MNLHRNHGPSSIPPHFLIKGQPEKRGQLETFYRRSFVSWMFVKLSQSQPAIHPMFPTYARLSASWPSTVHNHPAPSSYSNPKLYEPRLQSSQTTLIIYLFFGFLAIHINTLSSSNNYTKHPTWNCPFFFTFGAIFLGPPPKKNTTSGCENLENFDAKGDVAPPRQEGFEDSKGVGGVGDSNERIFTRENEGILQLKKWRFSYWNRIIFRAKTCLGFLGEADWLFE